MNVLLLLAFELHMGVQIYWENHHNNSKSGWQILPPAQDVQGQSYKMRWISQN